MATVTAFLRTSTSKKDKEVNIRFRLTDGRSTQLFYKSDLTILPKLWSNDTQSIKAKVAINEERRLVFNRAVEEIRNRILAWYVGLPDRDMATTEALQQFMAGSTESAKPANEDFATTFERFLAERKVSYDRKRQLRVVKNIVLRYERYTAWQTGRPYTFDHREATQQTIHSIERFITDEHKICQLYPELYLNQKKPVEQRGRNTVIGKMKYLRTFFLWAYEQELIPRNPFKNYTIEQPVYGNPIYINIDELTHLANAEMPSKSLEKHRDVYVFQCCIGCRHSDLRALRGSNANNGVVEYIARKTRESNPIIVRVPMNQLAKTIYERYKPEKPSDKLLPVACNQVYNRALKKIFAAAGLDRWVQTLDPKTREPKQERMCDFVASHSARKAFIGNIYKKVRDQNLVSSMTGHKPGSREFPRYQFTDDDMKRDMVSVLDNIK